MALIILNENLKITTQESMSEIIDALNEGGDFIAVKREVIITTMEGLFGRRKKTVEYVTTIISIKHIMAVL